MNAPGSLRLLVADDHELIRDALATILAAQDGWEVVATAADGAEAVRLTREHNPDVVLMDISMPGTDGIEATRQLTGGTAEHPHVIVLTTFDDEELVVAALRAGASGYLLKDLPRHRLFETIRAVLGGELQLSSSITRRLLESRFSRRADPDLLRALERLTERETEVLVCIGRGANNREIATDLYLSESTVKSYVGNLLNKLGARDRVQLVIAAYDAGLVS